MRRILLFNKPFDVLCQFTDQDGRRTLKDYINVRQVYAAGRLDRDSEGLLVLTNDGKLQSQISHPKHHWEKCYWVQVEGIPNSDAMTTLENGVALKEGLTNPAKVELIAEPDGLWPRVPPVRFRKQIPTSWIKLTIKEGKNRQVRRMTAAVGYPTLRLIRYRIGSWTIDGIPSGKWLDLGSGHDSL